ncbi:MAG TPA: outer membrane beta-barrel protein [Vicinamibacterales bacterium]|nr:outer membrane beta-barrel protein [Vicinamibacterales bacterium]
MRSVLRSVFPAVAMVMLCAAPGAAQGLGIGARVAMVRADAKADPSAAALRFFGGQLRARLSPKSAIELSLDRRVETSKDLSQRVTDYPLQASLLLFLVRSTFSPYVLGGVGWYTHTVSSLASDGGTADSTTTRKMGYHAGFGAEVLAGKHVGLGADYRYTFVHFGGNDSGGVLHSVVPSYRGSMWTAGVTFYF